MNAKSLALISFLLTFQLFSQGNESPYGINAHVGSNPVLEQVKRAGIKWIRIDLYWSHIEKNRGDFDFTEPDRIVSYCRENQLSILGVLSASPSWSNHNKGANHPPDDIEDWRNFVSAAVSRYRDEIRFWNIWNEPNVEKFFAPGKDVFVKKIFLPAAEIIRRDSPLSKIAGPELAHLGNRGSEWYFWMKYILTECQDYIDIVSHHIYKNTGVYAVFESLEIGENITPSVKEVIDESGFSSSPFWLTETGWDTELFSEEEQGNRYLEFLREMTLREFPHKIFFYQIIDDATPGIRPWGILRSDFTKKPAYHIYSDYISGIYPPPENREPVEFSKKCYMEETIAVSGIREKEGLLSGLRRIRDLIRRTEGSKGLTGWYYTLSPIMKELAGRFPLFRKYSVDAAVLISCILNAGTDMRQLVAGKTP